MPLHLNDDEAEALVRLLREAIDADHFPLSPRVQPLVRMVNELRPEPAGPTSVERRDHR